MRVVNVRADNCTHYIGRPTSWSPIYGINTMLGNPFAISMGATDHGRARREVIEKFEIYARRDPIIMQRIKELPKDAVLGCWCKPRDCHGDVIIKIWKEIHHGNCR